MSLQLQNNDVHHTSGNTDLNVLTLSFYNIIPQVVSKHRVYVLVYEDILHHVYVLLSNHRLTEKRTS